MKRERLSKARIEVAAGLVFRNKQLLIAQRFPDAHLGGLWEFPGGKRDPHETFEQCLHRELREELGIEVEIQESLETIVHDYPEKQVTLKFFRCAWKQNEPQALGCAAFRWVELKDLRQYKCPPADAPLWEKLGESGGWA